jgi:transcription termination/antitermination protein NusG
MTESKQWYVVNTYSGHENRVKENLEARVESFGIQEVIFKILVAEVEEIEVKPNKKPVAKMVNLFPGYLFVQMIMTDEAWYIIRNTPGVTGFIGSSGGGAKPFPVSEEEMENIFKRLGISEAAVIVSFAIKDKVRITSGPFSGMEGTVESMNNDLQTAAVLINLFGRETPTEIAYIDIEKLDLYTPARVFYLGLTERNG